MDIAARYQLVDILGEGGMGVVYRALDRLTGTPVALKRVTALPQHLQFFTQSESDDARLALAHEFQLLASLRHPNIIEVMDYGFDSEGRPFFTMTLLDQPRTIIETAQQQATLANIHLIVDVLQALAYLHQRGIVHRDLKPANVLISPNGQARVLDFGLALELGQRQGGGVSGTLLYMAPEVLLGQPPTPASDLYAVGLMLYEVLTGRHPFYQPDQPLSAYMLALMDGKPDLDALLKTVLLPNRPASRPAVLETTLQVAVGEEDLPHPRPLATSGEGQEGGEQDSVMAGSGSPSPLMERGLGGEVDLNTLPQSDQEQVKDKALSLHAIAAVLLRLLAVDPSARYQSALTVIHDLCHAAHLPLPPEDPAVRESFLQAARLVGRDAELKRLLKAYQHAADQQGSVWLVGGESGVGKSRLLHELRIHALVQGALVLRGQAVEGGGLPYQLWREPVRRLVLAAPPTDAEAAVLQAIVPDIASLLGRPIAEAPPLTGPADQQRLTLTIAALCQRISQPLVLLLEDLQWTSESLAVLKGLMTWVTRQRWLMVGTFRSDEMPHLPDQLPSATHLPLTRLDAEAVAALSESMLGAGGRDAALLALLQRETEGNVFFMVEVMRALAEEAGRLHAIGQSALPTKIMAGGVQAILRRRLARIPAWGQGWLHMAAVLGRQVDSALLVDDPRDLEVWLTVCINAAVLTFEEGVYQFAHDKLREHVLDELAAGQRAALHRQAALAIERVYPDDEARAAILAAHWDAAGEADRAVRYILKAAPALGARSAFADAQRLLERGLALTPDPAPRWHLYKELADVHDYYGDINQMERYVQLALALPPDLPGTYRGLLHMIEGRVAIQRGEYAAARHHLETALPLIEANDLDTTGILHNLGNLMKALGDYDAAAAYYQRSLTTTHSRQGLAIGLNNLGNVAQARGNYPQARAYYEASLEHRVALHDRYGEAIALNNLGNISKLMGENAAAQGYFERGLALNHQLGNQLGAAIILGNLAEMALQQGQLALAHDYFLQSLALSRRLDDHEGVVICLRGLVSSQARMGQPTQGQAYLLEGLRAVVDSESEVLKLIMLLGLIDLLATDGQAELAAQYGGLLVQHPAAEQETRDEYRHAIRPRLADALGEGACQQAEAEGVGLSVTAVLHQHLVG